MLRRSIEFRLTFKRIEGGERGFELGFELRFGLVRYRLRRGAVRIDRKAGRRGACGQEVIRPGVVA